jgi:hypothetical protein
MEVFCSQPPADHLQLTNCTHQLLTQDWLASVSCSVKLMLAFASTVIPGFSLLEIHDQDFYSLLGMYMFWNGASSSTKEGLVFLCRCYLCCTSVSAWVYPCCHRIQITMDSVHLLTLHSSKQYLHKKYIGFLSMHACGAGYPYVIILKLQLVSRTVIGLTTAAPLVLTV